jgi:hypothetical protein
LFILVEAQISMRNRLCRCCGLFRHVIPTEEDIMANFPNSGFSAADPDDEVDLDALVKKNPPRPRPAPDNPPKKKDTAQSKPHPVAPQSDEFDIGSLPKSQPQTPPPKVSETLKAASAISNQSQADAFDEHDLDLDIPAPRKRVRILPSFPTLILIIMVSVATALVTGIIIRVTAPTLESKIQQILSNQENTSIKVNTLEQTVTSLQADVKSLQEKDSSRPVQVAPSKKRKAAR